MASGAPPSPPVNRHGARPSRARERPKPALYGSDLPNLGHPPPDPGFQENLGRSLTGTATGTCGRPALQPLFSQLALFSRAWRRRTTPTRSTSSSPLVAALRCAALSCYASSSPPSACTPTARPASTATASSSRAAPTRTRSSSLRCTSRAAFSAGAGVRNLTLAPHFQYRPAIACAEYADALRRGTNELWHPVKDRSCLPTIVSGL